MTPLSRARSLMATGLRGLRSRLLLTVGSVLLAALAVGAAVVGPMYQTGAASSYLVTKLRSEPINLTGMALDYSPPSAGSGGAPAAALASARRLAARVLNDEFARPSAALWTRRLHGLGGLVRVASQPGQCSHVRLVGRCPQRSGEALILRSDSAYAHVPIGDTVRVEGVATALTIVGTYQPRDADESFWFDLSDLQSVPPQATSTGGYTPFYPGPLLVTPATFAHIPPASWFVRAHRLLTITPATSSTDLRQAAHVVATLKAQARSGGGSGAASALVPEPGNELGSIAAQVELQHTTARSTVAPAVVSVVLVALVLLLRLLSAAMDLRRPELALASLRGCSRRQLWFLGLAEPVLMLAAAIPIGIAAGFLSGRALGRVWLVPGLPMPLTVASLAATLVVVVCTLAVAVVVVRESVDEPLSAQIAGVRRPAKAGRWGLLLRLVLVAAAVAVLVATLAAGKRSSPGATDLALPILLATAAGLLTALLAQVLARRWASWSSRRRGVFSYLASRTISRRREGTLVILPLTAALAIALFSAGVYTAAADWRGSAAATVVGADRAYSTALTMDQAVALTHSVDPTGKWLMAVGVNYTTDGERVIMDTPRLPRVGVWPQSWTPGMSAADVAHALAPRRPSVVLRGSRVSLTIDNSVTGTYDVLGVDLAITRTDGSRSDVLIWPFRPGISTQTRRLHGCAGGGGCLLTALTFGGPAALAGAMHGTATIRSFDVDGKPVSEALDAGWRLSRLPLDTPSGIAGEPATADGRLAVRLSSPSARSVASITPDDVPVVRPVVVGRDATLTIESRLPGGDLELHTDAFIPLIVHPVATAESMPITGPTGMLVDYTMLTRDVSLNNDATFVSILARGDTPAPVTAALGARGIAQPQTLTTTRGLLDEDAFALALNLYLVVSVIVVLLALAGLGANLAVQLPSRRRDAASLRVVGLRRRSIIAAVIAEFVVVLGAAALAGVAAGSLGQYVVVRTVTLGYADNEHTPRLMASLNVTTVVELLLAVTAVLFVVATGVAALTVRGARTAGLREGG